MAFGKSHRDPFETPVGHLIEKATFAGVQTEDWGQFMHICDVINTTRDGPKDAVKALKKRISKNYNHKEIKLTLSLIDMCMQCCDPSFRSLIVKKDFVKEVLVKLLNPRYNLPEDIQNMILNFIRTWSQDFSGGMDISEVREVYIDLLRKGVRFPSAYAEAETAEKVSSNRPTPVPSAPALSSVVVPKYATITLVPEQIGKLHSELDMVKMNVSVMSTILMQNIPESEDPVDMELLEKLYKIGREMNERIVDLLVVVENEDITAELTEVNEELNNVILGYERYVRNKQRALARKQREDAETTSYPSAPSVEFFKLSPTPRDQGAAVEELRAALTQLLDPNVSSPSPVVTNDSQPSLQSQVDWLFSQGTETLRFTQETDQIFASSGTYENILGLPDSVLQPVSLQTMPATSSNERLPPLPSNHPATTKNDLQPPNYYEVMEFDPLAPAGTTEAVYEEIDAHQRKVAPGHSDC
ncbi:PREDICTED: TOM1-like protein 1 isoform X1 [Hipposideros armiger]|uniref:TOM1-like protein 1 isoform X1 n=3 Tax=Hipposideros armiger TaxID=186990 RepID=A0A8B7SVW4_HIPAR|nr:PREDICTED: TOM1-like protein 1 isoform X1 [Hipposideros armiger]XP_019516289.1 PREDICTED: TOM1-like protein 1 isoform X1 [Hipposideros armiger]XP_019516290.1 PREDICTED: TOM1-like protein 1 isoform X1 [Hipposideros armiger]